MKLDYKKLFYLVLLVLFVGLFLWAYPYSASKKTKADVTATSEGTYNSYGYVVTSTQGKAAKTATFQPAVQSDDAVVVGALQHLAEDIYNDPDVTNVQPVVETDNETNYVTFTTAKAKYFFQLFKNEKGEVGSVSFWSGPVPPKTS